MTNPNYSGPPYNYPPGTEVTMAEAATLTLYKLKLLQDSVNGFRSSSQAEISATRKVVSSLKDSVNELRSSSQADISAAQADITKTRELVQHLSEDIKRIEANQFTQIVTQNCGSVAHRVTKICENEMTKYAIGGVLVLAVGYKIMSVKGITVSDVLSGTKTSVASYWSSMRNHLGKKSAALAETWRRLSYRKPAEHKGCAVSGSQISVTDQAYSDRLLTLVIREAGEFDEDFLGDVFDYLNENHVAARGFISKPPNMRKKWLRQFSKKTSEKTEASH